MHLCLLNRTVQCRQISVFVHRCHLFAIHCTQTTLAGRHGSFHVRVHPANIWNDAPVSTFAGGIQCLSQKYEATTLLIPKITVWALFVFVAQIREIDNF